MRNFWFVSILLLVLTACSSTKIKIGNFTYKVKKEYSVTDPIHAKDYKINRKSRKVAIALNTNAVFYYNGAYQCRTLIKATAFGDNNDTIYARGTYYVFENRLICVTKHGHGYKNNALIFAEYRPDKNGKLQLVNYLDIPEEKMKDKWYIGERKWN